MLLDLKKFSVAGKSQAETLKERLNNVVERFKVRDNELRPDMGAVLAISNDYSEDSSGNLVSGDEILDTESLNGIATAVVMNAQARGEDPEAAINYLREELIRKNEKNPPYKMEVEN